MSSKPLKPVQLDLLNFTQATQRVLITQPGEVTVVSRNKLPRCERAHDRQHIQQ
jgi:hypothetical protein